MKNRTLLKVATAYCATVLFVLCWAMFFIQLLGGPTEQQSQALGGMLSVHVLGGIILLMILEGYKEPDDRED